jgi:type I restriction enzyme S subunit
MTRVEKLVSEHLDLWTAAIRHKSGAGRGSSKKIELYGVKKLRELILELAVRGKLVSQDSSDEPASELLKRIAAEKVKLLKEGKLKSDKALPPIGDEPKRFQIPKGWSWARVHDTGQYLNGLSFKESDWGDTGHPIIRIQNLSGRSSEFNRTERNVDESLLVSKGDLLVSWSGTLDVFVWEKDEVGVLNQHIFKVIPIDCLHKDYIFWLLKAAIKEMESSEHAHGLVMTHINRGPFLAHLIPVPPVEEQKRITLKLQELMALCDQLEQKTEASSTIHQSLVEALISALTGAADPAQFATAWQCVAANFDTLFVTPHSVDQLKQAILSLAVQGLLVEFPPCSKRGVLKNFLSFGPRNGFSPKESPVKTGQKVLKLGATSYGRLDLSETKYFDGEISSDSHLFIKSDDILIQRGNSHSFVGSNVLIESDVANVIYPDLMMKLRVNNEALSSYVSMWLSAFPARKHMWDGMTGTSGTMPKISKGVVESIPIVVPPIDVQERVVSTANYLTTICDQLKADLSDAQTTQLQIADAMVEQVLMGA